MWVKKERPRIRGNISEFEMLQMMENYFCTQLTVYISRALLFLYLHLHNFTILRVSCQSKSLDFIAEHPERCLSSSVVSINTEKKPWDSVSVAFRFILLISINPGLLFHYLYPTQFKPPTHPPSNPRHWNIYLQLNFKVSINPDLALPHSETLQSSAEGVVSLITVSHMLSFVLSTSCPG